MRALDFDRIDHIYIRCGYTDMRKGITLYVVLSSMHLDPYQNALVLFCSRKSSSVKGLLWEQAGFMLITKHLDEGRFQ